MQGIAPPLAPGLRQTLPRRLVWEAMGRLGPHCTAEEIADHLAARELELPRSTVYRALEALVVSGAIRAVHFGGGPARYEPIREQHQHAICQVCHGILHLEHALVRELEAHLARDHHFRPVQTEVVVIGICAGCVESGQVTPVPDRPHNLEHIHYASQPQ
ncbi:MAG: Fur family transcriptional regulator [Chloroflexota bacterium]